MTGTSPWDQGHSICIYVLTTCLPSFGTNVPEDREGDLIWDKKYLTDVSGLTSCNPYKHLSSITSNIPVGWPAEYRQAELYTAPGSYSPSNVLPLTGVGESA